MAWSQKFFDPIELPDGRRLVTLRDAALYITELPKAEHDAKDWQIAMQALLLVAERDGDPMFARIGVMRALHRDLPKAATPRRKRAKVSVVAFFDGPLSKNFDGLPTSASRAL